MIQPLKRAYIRHKATAKERGIGFLLTYDEWMKIWNDSGNISERGRGKDKYVMARIGDSGPYAVGNVEIIKHEQNSRDARANNKRSQYDLRSKQIGSGRGWSYVDGAYQVCVSRKYIGRFRTKEEAESAYKSAAAKLLASSSRNIAGINPHASEGDRK